MRAFLFSFIIAWVAGISAGVYTGSLDALLGSAAVMCVILYAWRRFLHHMVAILILFSCGWAMGQGSIPEGKECELHSQFRGKITEVHRVEEVRNQYMITDREGCILLLYTDRFPEYHAGDILDITGEVQPLSHIPGEYEGYAEYLKRHNIVATIRYPDQIRVVQSYPTFIDHTRSRIKERIYHIFLEPEASLMIAMVLGDQGTIPDTVQEHFRTTGTNHILSISGFHVSVISGMILGTLLLFPVHPWARTLVASVIIWMYVFLIGWQVPAVRASVFWTVLLFAARMRVLASLPTAILLAAVGITTSHPQALTDIGFQLSFAAVAGIGLTLFLIRGALSHGANEIGKFVQNMLFVSFGAVVTTWPVVVWHFGSFSVYAIPANIVVVPTSSFFLVGGVVAILASYISPPLALAASLGVHWVWQFMDNGMQAIASFPAGYIENLSIPLWGMAAYYCALIGVASYVLKSQSRTWREVWQ